MLGSDVFDECGDVSRAVAAVRGEAAAAGAVAAGNGETTAAVPAGFTGVVSISDFGCTNASLRHTLLAGDRSSALTVAIATAASDGQ